MPADRSPAARLVKMLRRLYRVVPEPSSRSRQLGQVLPLFVLLSVALLGGAALLTDVAWWWTNEQRMQRAADAAALAGAVYLPGNQAKAFSAALEEAEKNGYTNGVAGVEVTARRDTGTPPNPRKLIVDVSGPVRTNFARVLCVDGGPCLERVDIGVIGAAEYVQPVPMGSPENYYGVFGMTRGLTSTTTETITTPQTNRGWSCGSGSDWQSASCTGRVPSAAQVGTWTSSSTLFPNNLSNSLTTNNNVFARTSTTGARQEWSGFNAQNGMPDPDVGAGETLAISGLQVRVSDAYISSSCSGGNATIGVELSWDGGGATGSWTSMVVAPTSGSLVSSNTSTTRDYTIGSSTSMSNWGGHVWTRDEFSDSDLRVRLTANESCSGSKTFSVDMVEVRVTWDYNYTTTTTQEVTTNLPDALLKGPRTPCTTGKADCFEADGVDLNPRGFWATLNTQGAENVNGDAHQPGYDTRTSRVSRPCPADNMACYDAVTYYNYAVEMPPNSTDGAVYVYDPQFCAVTADRGTGDRWFGGSAAVSTFYEVYDTKNTPHDLTDDTRLASSDSSFRGIDAEDSTMDSNGTLEGLECRYRTDTQYGDGRDFHNRWYLLYSGMSGGARGHVYRIHTTSTDPGDLTQQLGTNGENSFAIFASATGGSPKVYGLGAMQAFTPLKANGSEVVSEFYLAQLQASHAGKIVEIYLWDPGDTNPLNARLQILIPTSGGWTPVTFTYTASQGTTDSSRAACNGLTSPPGGTNIVQTNVGNTAGTFNGCWLVLRAEVPSDYTAEQDGWWKIRYRMNGTGTSNDVTTWKVNLLGNPVHLVQP